jgi:hypothetical protein
MKQLALIDSLIPDLAIFKESLNDDTDFVIFDYYNDSLHDLCNNIETGMYEKIGIVQEDNGTGRIFHQFDNNTLVDFLKSRHHCQSLDLFMCNGYLSWKQEIDQLAELSGIKIGAANTLIGQGCWTLHNGVDVCQRYMKEYHMYPHVFMTQKPISIASIVIDDKVYDGTNSATISSYKLNDIFIRHSVSLTATFDDINAGNNKSISLKLGGKNSDSYCLTDYKVTANIIPKTLTISGITASDKEYDTTNTVSIIGKPTLIGKIEGDDVSLEYISSKFESSLPGNKNVIVSYRLIGESVSNYILAPPVVKANITPKILTLKNNTIVIQDKTYDGNDKAMATGSADLQGIFDSDNCILSGRFTFANKNAGTHNIIIGLNGIHSTRYTLPTDIFTATIYQKEVIMQEYHGRENIVKYYDGKYDVFIDKLESKGIFYVDRSITSVRACLEDTYIGKNKKITFVLNDPTGNYYLIPIKQNIKVSVLPNDIYYDPSTVVATSKQYDRNNTINISTPIFKDKNNSIVELIDCSFVGSVYDSGIGYHNVTISLSGPGAINYNLFPTKDSPVRVHITPIEVTFKSKDLCVCNKIYNGKNNANIEGMELINALKREIVGVSGASSIFEHVNVGTWNVRPYFSLIGISRKNYKLKIPEIPILSGIIEPATLKIGGDITV